MIRRPTTTATLSDYDDEVDPELAQRLPLGYRDRQSPNYIEPDLRQAVADYDPARLKKIRRGFHHATAATVRTVGKTTHHINPSDSEQALETVALWSVMSDIRNKRKNDANNAERAAYYDVAYGCSCCGQTATPNGLDGSYHTQRRRLVGGTAVPALCGTCAFDAELLAPPKHASPTRPDGSGSRR